jgi:hypothetical protein
MTRINKNTASAIVSIEFSFLTMSLVYEKMIRKGIGHTPNLWISGSTYTPACFMGFNPNLSPCAASDIYTFNGVFPPFSM